MSNFWIPANWNAPTNIQAGCTTRQFGNSLAPYEQGNLALHVQDNENKVLQNRDYLKQHLNLPNEPFWLEQTHSTKIINFGENGNNNQADASYTNITNQVLCILTADCLPILLCSKQGNEIAAVHAGWRGLADGIVANSVASFTNKPEEMIAWIGPAISQKHYEIGREVREKMLEITPKGESCFIESRPNHYFMDLSKLAEIQLTELGVNQVFQSNLCTFADEQRFYSYRRDSITGRIASLIWIAES